MKLLIKMTLAITASFIVSANAWADCNVQYGAYYLCNFNDGSGSMACLSNAAGGAWVRINNGGHYEEIFTEDMNCEELLEGSGEAIKAI
jgi:hypothetical protein